MNNKADIMYVNILEMKIGTAVNSLVIVNKLTYFYFKIK